MIRLLTPSPGVCDEAEDDGAAILSLHDPDYRLPDSLHHRATEGAKVTNRYAVLSEPTVRRLLLITSVAPVVMVAVLWAVQGHRISHLGLVAGIIIAMAVVNALMLAVLMVLADRVATKGWFPAGWAKAPTGKQWAIGASLIVVALGLGALIIIVS